jgi:hypothetical protein
MRIDSFRNSEAAKALTPSVQKFGTNAAVGNAAYEEIWPVAAAYNFLATAATLYIGSDDALDTAVTVTVEGLDANWDPQTVEIALDVTDPQADQVAVITAGGAETWIRVNRAWVSGATAAVGNVHIADEIPATWTAGGVPGTLGNTVAYIPIADQQTMQAVYSTPRNKTCALVSWQFNVESAQDTDGKLQVREFGGVFRTKSSVLGVNNATFKKVWDTYPKCPAKADIVIIGQAQAATSVVSAEFDTYIDI